MDRKTVIVLVVCFLLMLTWPRLVEQIYPPTPASRPAPAQLAPDTNAAAPAAPVAPPTLTAAPELPAVPAPSEPEQTLSLQLADSRYVFSSHGGGLKYVELLEHRQTINCRDAQAPTNLVRLNAGAPLPALTLLGGDILRGNEVYQLTQASPTEVRAETRLANGLQITKTFQVSSNHLVQSAVRLENRSSQPLALPAQEWVVGTATPLGKPSELPQHTGLFWHDGQSAHHVDEAWFANQSFLSCVGVDNPPRLRYDSPQVAPAWAAVHNQFFTMITLAGTNEPAAQVVGRQVPLATSTNGPAPQPTGIQTSIVYPASVLAPGQAVERSYQTYAGPKAYKTLSRLDHEQELVMDFGFFGFFAKVLLLSMNFFHDYMSLSYGLAIVAITILIKLIFWPLTKASTKSMKRMQALQPQMKALQEKYKDDPKKMNMKLMEFMKENKVSPLGGCLPMLIQIPVFFGFFTMIQSAIELRGASFLWACDLSQPDTLFYLPGLNFPVNLMPLLMGATMFWQARLTPPSPGMDPVQQKLMRYMPLMFLVFLYNFSAGLTLYWTVQNLLTIAQMKMTKPDPAPGVTPAKAPATAPKGPAPKKKK